MGTSRAALEIILQARDEASSMLSKATGMLQQIGGVAGTIATGGLAAAAAGTAAIGAGALAAGAKVFNFSQETDEAMRLFQAQVGASSSEMEDFRQQARDVFASGWGEDIGDISDAMARVNVVLDEQGETLQESTRRALILRDTFAIDVEEGVGIAAAAMSSGLADSSEEAFDMITKGFQDGLNQAGDFGDTLREYSSDFQRLGYDAEDMLGVLNAGLEAGAYNTDVVADGIREFGIRFGAAEESALEALDAIGVDSRQLYDLYQDGQITVSDAMATISGALGEVDDKTLQAQAGAALFGSKWEDVGGDVFIAAGQARDTIGELAGATDAAGESLSQGLGASIEQLKRTALANLAPLGDIVVEALGKAQPYVEKATAWLGDNLPIAVEWVAGKWETFFPQARDAVLNFWTGIQPGLIWVRDMFNEFSSSVLPYLRDGWDALQAGWLIVRGVLRDDLQPALQMLRESLGLNSESTGELMQMIGDFAGKILVTGIKGLIIGIAGAIGFVADGFERAAGLVDGFRDGIGQLRGTIDSVKGRIDNLGDAFRRLSIPGWLTPGSPTPFELGLRGIGDALDHLPDLKAQFNLSTAAVPMALSGAGSGGSVIQITQHFGPGSVRSDNDIEEIARRLAALLQIRGVRLWEI